MICWEWVTSSMNVYCWQEHSPLRDSSVSDPSEWQALPWVRVCANKINHSFLLDDCNLRPFLTETPCWAVLTPYWVRTVSAVYNKGVHRLRFKDAGFSHSEVLAHQILAFLYLCLFIILHPSQFNPKVVQIVIVRLIYVKNCYF